MKGSTGKITYDLHSVITENGHEASICYGRGDKIVESNIFKFGIDIETYVHAFLTRLTGLTGMFSPLSTYRLIKYMKKFNPDIVHIHELHAYFVNIAPVMKHLKKNNIKTIWTFHCEFMYTGKCGYAYDCNKWKTECGKCPQVKEYPASWFFDFTERMFRWKKKLFSGYTNLTIVTPSKWLGNRTKESFLEDVKLEVINNGIDTTVFYPRETSLLRKKHELNDERVVLAVAPNIMEERKGGKWVLELAKRFKDQNVKFILVGVEETNESFDDNIIALSRTNNQDELAGYYSMADIFVICSKKENFPTTCIEALCCGTPVVGFDEGGTKETAPGKFGKFVRYGDVDSLTEVIHSKLNNIVNMPSSEECTEFGKKNYDKYVMCNNYIELYKK